MERGRTDRWMSSPILVGTAKNGGYLDVFSVEPSESDAKVDKTPEPKDIWELYGPHWWDTLHSLTAQQTIVFDTETTGVNPEQDEAVSIAVQSYAAPDGAPVDYHTLIAPRYPEKLLYQNAKMKCAYDIHGIHPIDLGGQPPFPVVHSTLWKIMR